MKNVSIYIDFVFCIIVLPVMAMIFPIERWFHNFQGYMITVTAWLYAVYFINRAVTVPFLFRSDRKRIVDILLIVTSLVATYLLSDVMLYNPKPNIHDFGITRILPHIQQYQQAIWSLFMIVEAFSFAVGLLTEVNLRKSYLREVEADRDKAEIELYKARIKPHFMFNTLNSLYGLFLTQNRKALESLEKFISMMRYIYTTSGHDLVPLSDETDYIRQYVGLQSLRLNEMTTVTLDIDIGHDEAKVPPDAARHLRRELFQTRSLPCREKRHRDFHHRKRWPTPLLHLQPHLPHEAHRQTHGHRELPSASAFYPGKHRIEIDNDGHNYNVKLIINLNRI